MTTETITALSSGAAVVFGCRISLTDEMTHRNSFVVSVNSVTRLTSTQLAQQQQQATAGDSDVISFRIYANWFLPPSCG